ncbi:unnamed protein product, partial [Staurois parvus]
MYRLIHENINMWEVEMNYKCMARWYITLSVAHRLSGDNSPLCWRVHGGRGTMYHIWWECPRIQEYWEKILNLIRKITEVDIILDPETCLFHSTKFSVKKYKKNLVY